MNDKVHWEKKCIKTHEKHVDFKKYQTGIFTCHSFSLGFYRETFLCFIETYAQGRHRNV